MLGTLACVLSGASRVAFLFTNLLRSESVKGSGACEALCRDLSFDDTQHRSDSLRLVYGLYRSFSGGLSLFRHDYFRSGVVLVEMLAELHVDSLNFYGQAFYAVEIGIKDREFFVSELHGLY